MKKWTKDTFKLVNSIPLEGKIYGIVVMVIILISSLSLIEVRYSLQETLSTQLDERVKSIGRDVAARSVDLLLTNNIYLLHELAQDTVRNNPDLLYVIISDEEGEVIAHTFDKQGISDELIQINQVKPDERLNLIKFVSDDGVIRDVAIPILEGVGGTVRVGLTEDTLLQALYKVTTQLLFTMTAVLILAGIISFGLTRILTFPISRLLNMTKEVSKGNLSIRLEPFAIDEIGKLTIAFNKMLSHLEKTNIEKNQYYQKVVLRNKELSLLNELSGNITSVGQMKMMLEKYIQHLVYELDFNSGVLKITLLDKIEVYHYTKPDCSCTVDILNQPDPSPCVAGVQDLYKYNFEIAINDFNIGKIQICSSRELDQQSVNLLKSISKQLAVSIENVKLWHELKQKEEMRQKLLAKLIKAQEEERKRIARELHDETSQSLTSILLGLSLIAESKNEEERSKAVSHLRTLIQGTLQEVHEMAWQLRPSVLDKFGLTVAIERYIEEYRNQYSIDVDLYMENIKEIRMSSEIEISVYRIIQEALTNVAKYAKAENVSIIINQNNNLLTVIIEDDGVGFDAEKVLKRDPSKYNLGLHGMLERTAFIGGKLTIESEPGKGTSIFVKIPLSKRGISDIEQNKSTHS